MNQSERRRFLIRELLEESRTYRDMTIPDGGEEQKQLLRGLMNIRPPREISEEFLEIQDEYLKEETRKKGITELDSLAGGYHNPSLRCDCKRGQQSDDRLLYSEPSVH